MNYVMIGNAAAAIGTVEGIRQIDKTGPSPSYPKSRTTYSAAPSSPIYC